jgi:hypothetical protein
MHLFSSRCLPVCYKHYKRSVLINAKRDEMTGGSKNYTLRRLIIFIRQVLLG